MVARLAAVCACLLYLSGCTGVPERPQPVAGRGTGADSLPVPHAAVTAAAGDPYLEGRQAISEEARRRFATATSAMASADWEGAAGELQWLMEEYPALSGAYLNMALLHQVQGKDTEAEHFFKAALEVNERNLEAYNQYAIFLRQRGRFDDAEAVYLAALAVWSDHAATHRNLGVLYDLYRGDRERALEHYRRYQALTDGEDRAVAGWIVDLERRYGQLVQVAPQ